MNHEGAVNPNSPTVDDVLGRMFAKPSTTSETPPLSLKHPEEEPEKSEVDTILDRMFERPYKALDTHPPPRTGFMEDIKFGWQNELASAVQGLRNGLLPVSKVISAFQSSTGATQEETVKTIDDHLKSLQDWVGPTQQEAEAERGISGRVASAIGAAPLQLAEYMLPTKALKGVPAPLIFAFIDAMKNVHRGPIETARAAVVGGATGWGLQQLPRIPTISGRIGAGSAISAAGAVAHGGKIEDVAAGAIVGGAWGGMTPGAKPITPRVRVIEKAADLPPILDELGSPHTIFQNVAGGKAYRLIHDVILAERKSDHDYAVLEGRFKKAIHPLTEAERLRAFEYLDDPQYTLDSLPTDSPKVRQAFVSLRNTLNTAKELIVEGKRKEAIARGEDPESVTEWYQEWGKEEGYLPHGWEGPWRIIYTTGMNEAGDPIWKGIPTGMGAETKVQAEAKAAQFIRSTGGRIRPEQVLVVEEQPRTKTEYAIGKGKRFWGHAQERESGLGGFRMDEGVLYDYAREAARYSNMAPLRPDLIKIQKSIHEAAPHSKLRNAWDRYVDVVEGRPDKLSQQIDRFARQINPNVKPQFSQRWLGVIRGSQALMKLGFSPVSAFMNAMQVPMYTLPILGARWTMRGYKMFGENILDRVNGRPGRWDRVLDELFVKDAASKSEETSFIDAMRLNLPKRGGEIPAWAWDQAMYFGMYGFRKVEYSNHAVTTLGAYARSRSEGSNHQQALRKALEVDVRSQFSVSPGDIPLLLSSPWARTAFQFKPFLLKSLEYMSTLGRKDVPARFQGETALKESARFLGTSLLATGVVGLPFAESFDALIEHLTSDKYGRNGYSVLDEIRGAYPDASKSKAGLIGALFSRGVPGLFGQDVTKNIGAGDYLSLRQIERPWGPAVEMARLAAARFTANPGYPTMAAEKKIIESLSPAAIRIYRGLRQIASNNGDVRDSKGRVIITNQDWFEKALAMSGFKSIRQADEGNAFIRATEWIERQGDLSEGFAEQIAKALEEGRYSLVEQLADEAVKAGNPDAVSLGAKRFKNRVSLRRLPAEIYRKRRALYLYLQGRPDLWAQMQEALSTAAEDTPTLPEHLEPTETPPDIVR